jgi:predicted phosphodiesterase
MNRDERQSTHSRRQFLKESAALAASFAALNTSAASDPVVAPAFPEPLLYLPPFLSSPTENTIRITALNEKRAANAVLEIRKESETDWKRQPSTLKLAPYELLSWSVKDLTPATRYEYQVLSKPETEKDFRPAGRGSFRTQRKGPASYTVLLMTDPHTGSFPLGSQPALVLDKVVQNATPVKADFLIDLGDNVAWRGSREFPQTTADGALMAYSMYRRQIGPLSANTPHFAIIGNWNGESGKFPEKSIDLVTGVRKALLPGPNHLTYPQGGSEREDYYAFTWGDVLYVMLNIQTYSKPSNPANLPSLMSDVNEITEWTLGEKQMVWFETTLRNAKESFRFVCIHHPAAGNAGDSLNTNYGRGGARAWNLGEQAKIHALMKKHKVQIFFYGHDHVFVDDIVDGIHYTLPGSCGAPWKFTRAETGYERFWPDSGHATLEVTPEKATVTFFNLENKVLHTFSVVPA